MLSYEKFRVFQRQRRQRMRLFNMLRGRSSKAMNNYIFTIKDENGFVFTTEIFAESLNEAHNELIFEFSFYRDNYEIIQVEEVK